MKFGSGHFDASVETEMSTRRVSSWFKKGAYHMHTFPTLVWSREEVQRATAYKETNNVKSRY